MGSKRQNNKSTGKAKNPATTATKAVEAPQVKEPFALVLYDSIQMKGVVETIKIAKRNRVVGEKCLAPNPIDYGEAGQVDPDSSKKFPAKVIAFGYNIDYLYEIPVFLGSDAEKGENQQEVAAKKSRLIEKEVKKRKQENLIQEDSNVVKKIPLFSQGGFQGSKSTKSVLDCSDPLVPISDQLPTKSTITGSKSPVTSSDLFSTLDGDMSDSDDELLGEEASTSNKSCNKLSHNRSESNCDLQNNTSKGSIDLQEALRDNKIVFFPFVCPDGDSCLFHQVINSGTDSEKLYLKRVIDAAEKHQLAFGQQLGGGSNKSRRVAAEQNKMPESMFSCFDSKDKYPVVSGLRVYIPKPQLMSLPPIEGQTNKYVKQVEIPAVSVRTMVNNLVDCIIEEDILKDNFVTCKNLPKDIPMTIAAYINMRLKETDRRLQSHINRYITDRCRRFHRDRDLEATKRLVAEASGKPPTKRPRKTKEQ